MVRSMPSTRRLYRWRDVGIGAAIVLLLIICRFEILTSPPYWDAAIGLWTEGAVIQRNRFDLWNHWVYGQHSLMGGETSYRFSLLPAFVGVLMAILPSPTLTFVVYHLLTFACTAAIAVLIARLFAPATGVWVASLAAAVLLTAPVFSTQIDMLGMEIPLALVTVLCASLVASHRYSAAVLVTLAGMLIKATSFLLLLALVVQLVLLLFAYRKADPALRRRIRAGWLAALPALGVAWLLLSQEANRIAHVMPGIFVVNLVWFPDLAVVSAIGILFILGWCLWPTHPRSDTPKQSWIQQIGAKVRGEPLVLFSAIAIVGTFLSFVFAHPVPRYVVFVMPLMLVLLLFILGIRPGSATGPPTGIRPSLCAVTLGAIIGFQLLNWNGAFYPSPDTVAKITYHKPSDALRRDGSILERTRAYLPDHNANIALFQSFSENWDGAPVFVGFPFCAFVTLPELGYVKQAMNGYLTNGYHWSRGGLGEAALAVEDSPAVAWFVYSRNPVYQHLCRFYVPPPTDAEEEVLQVLKDEFDPPVVIYQRTLPKTELSPGLRNWYLQHLGPHPQDALEYYPREFHDRDWAVPLALQRVGHKELGDAYLRWRWREPRREQSQ